MGGVAIDFCNGRRGRFSAIGGVAVDCCIGGAAGFAVEAGIRGRQEDLLQRTALQ